MTDLTMRGRALTRSRRLVRRMTPIVAAATLAIALVSGCTSGSEDTGGGGGAANPTSAPADAPLPDGAQLVAESAKTTQTLQYVHAEIAAKNVPNLPMETVSADITNQPQGSGQAKGKAKVKLKPEDPFVDTQFLVVEKKIYTAVDGSSYRPVGDAEKIYDPGVILDKDKGLANAIAQIKNPKTEARETVDGIATVKVSGTIDAAVIDPIAPGSGIEGTYPITVYIADIAPPSDGAPQNKPSEEASTGEGPNLVKAVITKDSGTIEVALSKWGDKFEVAKPQG